MLRKKASLLINVLDYESIEFGWIVMNLYSTISIFILIFYIMDE